MAGAKELLYGVLALGLPQTMSEDELLRGSLRGVEGLLDSNISQIGLAAAKSPSELARPPLQEVGQQRLTAFETRLRQRLLELEAAQSPEHLRMISLTLSKLELLRWAHTEPVLQPALQLIGRAAGNATVQINGEPYMKYVLQASPDLRNWTDLPGTVTDLESATLPTSSGSGNFLRVILR